MSFDNIGKKYIPKLPPQGGFEAIDEKFSAGEAEMPKQKVSDLSVVKQLEEMDERREVLLKQYMSYVGKGYGDNGRGIIISPNRALSTRFVNKMFRVLGKNDSGAIFDLIRRTFKFLEGETLEFAIVSNENDAWKYHGKAFPFMTFDEGVHPDVQKIMGGCNRDCSGVDIPVIQRGLIGVAVRNEDPIMKVSIDPSSLKFDRFAIERKSGKIEGGITYEETLQRLEEPGTPEALKVGFPGVKKVSGMSYPITKVVQIHDEVQITGDPSKPFTREELEPYLRGLNWDDLTQAFVKHENSKINNNHLAYAKETTMKEHPNKEWGSLEPNSYDDEINKQIEKKKGWGEKCLEDMRPPKSRWNELAAKGQFASVDLEVPRLDEQSLYDYAFFIDGVKLENDQVKEFYAPAYEKGYIWMYAPRDDKNGFRWRSSDGEPLMEMKIGRIRVERTLHDDDAN